MPEAAFNCISIESSAFDPAKLALRSNLQAEVDLISNCCGNFKKTVSFDLMLCFTEEENNLFYVDFVGGLPLHPEDSTKATHSNLEGTNTSTSCENIVCFQSNDQQICFFFDKEHGSNLFLSPYKVWDMDPAAPLTNNHAPDRGLITI